MNTLNLGIEINQNTDFSLIILIQDSNGPIDITDYQFKGQVRATTDPTSPTIAEFVFEIQDQSTNKGQLSWSLPAMSDDESSITTSTATPLVECRKTTPFLYDVKMKDNNGIISRIIQGIMYVSPEATQEAFT